MNKKQICKVAGFLLVLLVCVSYLTEVFMNKWQLFCYESVVPKEFYKLDKNSVEVGFFGSSQVTLGISGMEMYKDYGISAYTFGTANQPMLMTYTWLKECYKTQKLKVALVDVSALYYNEVKESRYHQALDNMRLSLDKIQAIYEHCKLHSSSDPFFSYIFKISKYHSRWDDLTEEDFADTEDQPVFRGNVLYSDTVPVDFERMVYDNDEPDTDLTMNSEELSYMNKIVSFCEEKGISLVLIKTPRYDWSITKHQQVQAYAEKNGIEFLDFSSKEMLEAVGLDVGKDFMDIKHLNIDGAVKLSDYLGAYLAEQYEPTDFRNVAGYDELNYEKYCERLEDSKLQRCEDTAEYLQYLDNERYDILIQTTADLTGLCSQDLIDTFASFDVVTDINSLNGAAFVCEVNGGVCAYERASSDNLRYSEYLSDGTRYSLYSSYTVENIKIKVDFEDYTFANTGINMLVYDNQNQKVVDKSTISYDAEVDKMVLLKENEAYTM